MIWLLQVSPLIVGTLTVIFFVALSLLGLFIFRRVVSQTRLESAHNVSGEVFFSLAFGDTVGCDAVSAKLMQHRWLLVAR